MPRKKRGGRGRVANHAPAQNHAPAPNQEPDQQEQPAADRSWWSYVPFASVRERLSKIREVASPFLTPKNVAVAAATNVVLPLASGFVAGYLFEENEGDSYEVRAIKRALAFMIPMTAMTARNSINTLLAGLLREGLRDDFMNKLQEGDVLNLRNHSPCKITGPAGATELINLETARFSLPAIQHTLGVFGNTAELVNLVNGSYRLAGPHAAFATAAIAVLASLLTAKASAMCNKSLNEGWDMDDAIGRDLRSVDNNRLPIAGLNAQTHELRKLQKMIEERRQLRISSSYLELASSLIHMLLFYSTPQVLRSLKSFYPEGMTQIQIEQFSAQVVHSMATLGNMIRPLTQNQQEFERSIERLLQLHAVMDDVIKFLDEALLKINYSCGGNSIELVNLTMAKPSPGDHRSLTEKVKASLADEDLSTIKAANLTLQSGKTYQLLGDSGLGKSSLLKACTGLWPYASGTINFPCSKEEVYFITQEPFMPLRSTLLEIMVYPQDATKIEGDKKEKLTTLMNSLGLSERIEDLDGKEPKDWSILSRGEQQRIVIIRMVMQELKPKVIFMDEATASVDKERASQMYKMVKEYLPDATIVYVSHDVSKTSEVSGEGAKPSSTFEMPSFADATITIQKESGKLSVVELAAKAAKVSGVDLQASCA